MSAHVTSKLSLKHQAAPNPLDGIMIKHSARADEETAMNLQQNPLYYDQSCDASPQHLGQPEFTQDASLLQHQDWQRALSGLSASHLASIAQAFTAFLLTSTAQYRDGSDLEQCPTCGTEVPCTLFERTAEEAGSSQQRHHQAAATKGNDAGQHFLTADSTLGRTMGDDTLYHSTAGTTLLRPAGTGRLDEELDQSCDDQFGGDAGAEEWEVKLLPEFVGLQREQAMMRRAKSSRERSAAPAPRHLTYSVSMHEERVVPCNSADTPPSSEDAVDALTSPDFSPNKQYGG
jgi:hypothetical protein